MSAGTLLDVFSPPEDMVGHSAALVAMTGTEDFLEDAVQRFTGLRPRQRSELGHVLVYLMLDGHASPSREHVIPPGRIPGLHEFHPRTVNPGSLLHAKIALLAFAPNRAATPTHLRLAVLTANFTYASARRQLELVWTVDVRLDSSIKPAQDRADIAEAGRFVTTLLARRFHRDEQAIPRHQRQLTARLDVLLSSAAELPPTNRTPRFFHSLDRPLFAHIRERFHKGIKSPRNLLLCGSGFYEEPAGKPRKPTVLGKLERVGLFTANVRRVLLVEPQEAGAVAGWAKSGDTDGWELTRPNDALGRDRRLHAKFVYAGYHRNGHLSNGWLYLGSGNLSRRGLLTDGTMPKGNVEAGVVFAVNDRYDEDTIARSFFWSDDEDSVARNDWQVGQVGDAPEEQPLLEVPPILSATIELLPERHLRLHWREDVRDDISARVQWAEHDWAAARPNEGILLGEGDAPAVLHVRVDGRTMEWLVPVVDPAGRVCWQPRRFDAYADALWALLDFPIRPAEVASDEDDDIEGTVGGPRVPERDKEPAPEKSYALYAAAELIEKVSALQTGLPAARIDEWLDHLDRSLRASFPEPLVATWRELRLNVFAHLRQEQLRPNLTETQRARYCEVLDAASAAWGLR